MGEIPLMTDNGSFIINGTERVIVSQLHRSPGVFFEHDRGKTHCSGKLLFSARVIPYRGSWLDFEFDPKDFLFFRVDRRRKMPVTTLLKAIGLTNEDILREFFVFDTFHLSQQGRASSSSCPSACAARWRASTSSARTARSSCAKDKRITARHVRELAESGVKRIAVPADYVVGRSLATNVVDKSTGEMLAKANDEVTEELLEKLSDAGIDEIKTIYTNDLDMGPFISQTLRTDDTPDQYAAKVAIYRMMRPGEPPTEDAVEALFHGLFFAEERYDLSAVGRMKFNRRVGRDGAQGLRHADQRRHHRGHQDPGRAAQRPRRDRRHRPPRQPPRALGGRARREPVPLRPGARRARGQGAPRPGREREPAAARPDQRQADLARRSRSSSARSQLSQFMDQTNPLSEITHKRRVSALGPGGLTRERAGFEVRDVHPTHYGRVCPIETPEGPNIGLINSLALYARTNEYGFLETPYRKVVDGKVTDEIHYLSAIEEGQYVIAQANAKIDEKGKLADELVSCRNRNEFMLSIAGQGPVHGRGAGADRVGGRVADPVPRARRRQPRADGLEHAAPGGALPAAGEAARRHRRRAHGGGRLAARRCMARRGGKVDYVDASRIVVRVNDAETAAGEVGVDIYNLTKYTRRNQNTNINQRPLVQDRRPDRQGRRDRRRRVDRHGRAGARPEHAGRVHAVERLQLRGLDPDQRAGRRRRPLHVDPHRGAVGRRARHQARPRGNHARHLRASAKAQLGAPRRRRASSTSAPKSKRATCWSARSRRRARRSSRRKRSCCARSSARRRPT